jgi:hypothetical protein
MCCERRCVTEPRSRPGLQLDIFIDILLPQRWVKTPFSNGSSSDVLDLICGQLGHLIEREEDLVALDAGFIYLING